MSSSQNRTPLPSEPSQKAIEAHRRDPPPEPIIDPGSATQKCVRCPNRVPLGTKMCESCRFKHNERRKKSYQKMKREGICTVCASRKAVPGFLECQACSLRRQASRAEAKRSKGVLCVACKTQLVHDGTSVCQACRDCDRQQGMEMKEEEANKTANP